MDRKTTTEYEVRYSPGETTSQIGAHPRAGGNFPCETLKRAKEIRAMLRDTNSWLHKECKPNISSVFIYEVTKIEEIVDLS